MKMNAILQPFAPPLETLRHYDRHKLRKDLIAGVTVSVVEVPQSMAYALIAGVPPQYGLYSSILQGVVGALLSSSEHMTTGPTNTQSLLISSSATAAILTLRPELSIGSSAYGMAYLELVFALTLLKGIMQLAFAAARMGNVVRYISRSVIAGLTAGAGMLIFFGQFGNFLGVHGAPVKHPWPGIPGALQRLWPALRDTNLRAVTVGVACLLIVLVTRRISKFIPGALISVVLAAGVMAATGNLGGVPTIGALPSGFAHFHVPQLSGAGVQALAGGALALAVLGMIESVAIAKSIASHTGERISANQEFFAQGLKNTLTSFFQCIPGSGSFTRSALDYAAGAETRFAAVFNALFVAVIYFLFRDRAALIPLTSLAAVLFVVGAGLIDWRYIARIIRTSKADTTVCAITFLATLFAPLEYAIFIGVFLNLALYLHVAGRLQMVEMIPAGGGDEGAFREMDDDSGALDRDVMLLNLEGSLFFGMVDELEHRFNEIVRRPARVVILRFKRTHAIDATVLGAVERFAIEMRQRNRDVLLCGVRPAILEKMEAFGLIGAVGRDNVFPAREGTFEATRHAVHRARSIVGKPVDDLPVEQMTPLLEPWSYDI